MTTYLIIVYMHFFKFMISNNLDGEVYNLFEMGRLKTTEPEKVVYFQSTFRQISDGNKHTQTLYLLLYVIR